MQTPRANFPRNKTALIGGFDLLPKYRATGTSKLTRQNRTQRISRGTFIARSFCWKRRTRNRAKVQQRIFV
jgi:hypothetical protein